MHELHYHLVDVFTDQQFGGNQLAVFPDGRGISDAVMQAIAKELRLSETTFVLPPDDPAHDCRVRIFTPARELPMAGHPTVGTAYVLAREGRTDIHDGEATFTFEEGVGPIPVTLAIRAGQPEMIWMQQPQPTFGPVVEDRATFADMLSLSPEDLDPRYPLQIVSTGVPFLYVPLASLDAARRARLRHDLWERVAAPQDIQKLFLFTQEVEYAGSTVHSRMFAPGIGIAEDAATGSASGPLGCYLVQYGLAAAGQTIISEQGIEMGRPSFLHICIEREGDVFTRVGVGGKSVYVGRGTLSIRD
jgi:trans-2,3-dihydro-3-hydroxyanthranilate isomerase